MNRPCAAAMRVYVKLLSPAGSMDSVDNNELMRNVVTSLATSQHERPLFIMLKHTLMRRLCSLSADY